MRDKWTCVLCSAFQSQAAAYKALYRGRYLNAVAARGSGQLMKDVIKQAINILRAAPPSCFSVMLTRLVALCLARLLMFVLRLLELTIANINKPTFDFDSTLLVHIRQGSLFQRIKFISCH